MTIPLYSPVVLTRGVEEGTPPAARRWPLGTVGLLLDVYHDGPPGAEDWCIIEVLDAVGQGYDVACVPLDAIAPEEPAVGSRRKHRG